VHFGNIFFSLSSSTLVTLMFTMLSDPQIRIERHTQLRLRSGSGRQAISALNEDAKLRPPIHLFPLTSSVRPQRSRQYPPVSVLPGPLPFGSILQRDKFERLRDGESLDIVRDRHLESVAVVGVRASETRRPLNVEPTLTGRQAENKPPG
jgi:hypothetical protein